MRVLLALVGEQPTPNLIPLFAARREERAEQVRFLVSEQQRIKDVAGHLKDALEADHEMKAGGLQVADPLGMNAWDLTLARRDFADALRQHTGDEVAVNLTGGTKIMSLAAYLEARDRKLPMVYVNTEREEIIHFSPEGAPEPRPFAVHIPIVTQLRAAGQELKKTPKKPLLRPENVPAERAEFVMWLVENYRNAYELCLKKVVGEVGQKLKAGGPMESQVDGGSPKVGLEGLRRLAAMRLIMWSETDRLMKVVDDSAWAFLNGGWVETYALINLAKSEYFDEVVGNLEVEDFEGEIDVAVTRNGRLGLVECKTRGAHGEGPTFAAAKMRQNEAVFGGPYAGTVFALAACDNIQDFLKAAKQYGIKNVVCGDGRDKLGVKGLKDLGGVALEMLRQ